MREQARDLDNAFDFYEDLERKPNRNDLVKAVLAIKQATDAFDDLVRSELGISRPRRRVVVEADSLAGIFAEALKQVGRAEIAFAQRIAMVVLRRPDRTRQSEVESD